jgi:hypothetical protein
MGGSDRRRRGMRIATTLARSPAVSFRTLLIGAFGGVDSERGIQALYATRSWRSQIGYGCGPPSLVAGNPMDESLVFLGK